MSRWIQEEQSPYLRSTGDTLLLNSFLGNAPFIFSYHRLESQDSTFLWGTVGPAYSKDIPLTCRREQTRSLVSRSTADVP